MVVVVAAAMAAAALLPQRGRRMAEAGEGRISIFWVQARLEEERAAGRPDRGKA